MIEHAGGIVEDQTVDLTDADDDLKRMAQRMRRGYEGRDKEAKRSPGELCVRFISMDELKGAA